MRKMKGKVKNGKGEDRCSLWIANFRCARSNIDPQNSRIRGVRSLFCHLFLQGTFASASACSSSTTWSFQSFKSLKMHWNSLSFVRLVVRSSPICRKAHVTAEWSSRLDSPMEMPWDHMRTKVCTAKMLKMECNEELNRSSTFDNWEALIDFTSILIFTKGKSQRSLIDTLLGARPRGCHQAAFPGATEPCSTGLPI